MIMIKLYWLGLFVVNQVFGENIPATKVFVLPLEPSMFNWTKKIGDEFSYRASLLNAPDLPKWIEYMYSKKHKTGYLYGVPPQNQKELEIISTSFFKGSDNKWNFSWVQIEIIGLNVRTYETRRRIIHLNVENKLDAATHQVHIKIDNLNVDDFFDSHRMSRLLRIFKYKLWKESFFDLYFTFLISAVSLGARRPLRPSEGEGVVVRLGSIAEFSNKLIELQEEVKPLWKLQSCPRDFKRTSVERLFREEGFILDWCNFRLIYDSLNAVETISSFHKLPENMEFMNEPLWSRPTKAQVSRRNYTNEFALTILLPAFIMLLLVILLSAILGIQDENMKDESDDFFDSIFCVCEDYCRLKKKIPTTEINVSRKFENTSRPSSALCAFSDFSETSNHPLSTKNIAINGLSRPTPPPYKGTAWTSIVNF